MDIINSIKSGGAVATDKLIELRAKGMHAVRFEFIIRLLRLDTQILTLSIYWDSGRAFMKDPVVTDMRRKLVYAGDPRVSGSFSDLALLCYPYDADARAEVDAELNRMVAAIGDNASRKVA